MQVGGEGVGTVRVGLKVSSIDGPHVDLFLFLGAKASKTLLNAVDFKVGKLPLNAVDLALAQQLLGLVGECGSAGGPEVIRVVCHESIQIGSERLAGVVRVLCVVCSYPIRLFRRCHMRQMALVEVAGPCCGGVYRALSTDGGCERLISRNVSVGAAGPDEAGGPVRRAGAVYAVGEILFLTQSASLSNVWCSSKTPFSGRWVR